MKRIALDLELNTDGVNPTEDIIQIGYTAFDTETGIIETSGDYIKINKPLYPYITKLTGINQHEIDTRSVSLAEAYYNLLKFCEKHEVKFGQLVTWGSGDHEELKLQLDGLRQPQYDGGEVPAGYIVKYFTYEPLGIFARPYLCVIDWKFGRAELNLKAVFQMYAVANNIQRSGGLKKSMKAVGLDFVPFMDKVADGKFRQRGAHDARCDALNTARMYLKLQEKMKGI